MTEILPQKKFPLIDRYRQRFPAIRGNKYVIFAYDNKIYTDFDLPDHLIIHEQTHLDQQNRIGLDVWVEKYLSDDKFRLDQEMEAYKNQISSITNKHEKEYFKKMCSKDLSSEIYGRIITYNEVYKILSKL